MKSYITLLAASVAVTLIVVSSVVSAQEELERRCLAPITRSRPGNCPSQQTAILCTTCIDKCRADIDCPRRQKCCPHPGCGNECQRPTFG